MFGNKRIKELEKAVERLEKEGIEVRERLKKLGEYEFYTGANEPAYGYFVNGDEPMRYGLHQRPVIKQIPISRLLESILNHLGLELKYTEGAKEKVEVVKKPKAGK